MNPANPTNQSADRKRPHKNFALSGNYSPIQEEFSLESLEIEGSIPKDLNGRFFRIGPNPQFEPGPNHHWFLGDGMVHGFHLQNGKVSYKNRYVKTRLYEFEKKVGKAIWTGYHNHRLTPSIMGMGLFEFIYNCFIKGDFDLITDSIKVSNTAIYKQNGRLFALVESSSPTEIDPHSLETIGDERFGIDFHSPFTAHPKVDPDTKEIFAFGYRFKKPYLSYYRIDNQGKMISNQFIHIDRAVMIHDFCVTKKYTVLPVLPAFFKKGSVFEVEYRPEKGARLGFMPRYGKPSEIKWIEIPACYVYHFMNSYDDGDEIVIDAVSYNHLPLFGTDTSNNEKSTNGKLVRWRINTTNWKFKEQILYSEKSIEFPRIDDRFNMKKYTIGFSTSVNSVTKEGMPNSLSIFQFNNEKTISEILDFGEENTVSEPIFVPRSLESKEGDGYLLSVLYDNSCDRSELLVVDSKEFKKGPIARVKLPHRIPHGFHGEWLG